jgi:sulfite exporter TauE/SafE
MALSVIISAWLVGLLGGLHCLAMCGGFVAAAAMRDGGGGGGNVAPLVPARVLTLRQLGYHGGRIGAYVLLGAAFGAAGATALRAAEVMPIQRALYIVANGFLLLLALGLVTRSIMLQPLQRAGATVFGRALPILQPLLRQPGIGGRLALGIVWGFVPCGLVYGTLPLALFAGSAVDGAIVMLAFGIGRCRTSWRPSTCSAAPTGSPETARRGSGRPCSSPRSAHLGSTAHCSIRPRWRKDRSACRPAQDTAVGCRQT